MTSPLPTPKPDHRTLPRKKRAPSMRDQAILVAYRVEGRTQEDLAEKYRLSQRRISAIISRVERWRADVIPAAEGELDRKQRERFERWAERERLQGIQSRAMRAYDTQPTELKTVREGHRDGKPFREETTRQLPPNVQLLKVALRASVDLGKLNDKPPLETNNAKESRQRFWQACELILDLRREAAERGEITTDSFDGAVVKEWMDALLGKGQPAAASATGPGVGGDNRLSTRSDEFPQSTAGPFEDAPSNRSNCSNPAAPAADDEWPAEPLSDAAEVEAVQDVPAPEPVRSAAPTSPPTAPQKKNPRVEPQPLSLAERRRLHQQKLDQLRDAQRRGLPIMVHFDPADGPIPRPHLQIDDFGYQPTPPPTREQRIQENEEYLAFLRAQHEANTRRWHEAQAAARS
jgi:Sigma-70, region 4